MIAVLGSGARGKDIMKSVEEIKKQPNLMIKELSDDGGFGYIFQRMKPWATVLFSWSGGWEHVSVSPLNKRILPTWEEMCKLKDMFFLAEEWVVQYHPAESEYVNNVPNCLHLWRPLKQDMPVPPAILTGIKEGMSNKEIKQEIDKILKEEKVP